MYTRRVWRLVLIGIGSALLVSMSGNALWAQAPAVTYADIHDFNGGAGDPTNFNSTRPAQGRDGNLYLESRSGGTSNQGTLFYVSPAGTVHVVLSFNGTNGSAATGGVTLGTDGSLYGDAQSGGTSNDGVTFKVTPTGTYTALHNFANSGDGYGPVNALVLGTDGNYYGLTNSQPETFYKVTSAGVLTTLHTFATAEGYQGGQLIQGSDGSFYGGVNLGGANGTGTLFKLTSAGVLTVLHNFAADSSDGTQAAPGMVQAANGSFFGTASLGGANGNGVVYKLTSSGTFTLLHSLASATDGNGPQVLVAATDGNMYGTTYSGGTNNCGTLFKVTQAGVFSVLYNFASATGCNPGGYLAENTNGLLYGVTTSGGAHGNGVFFSLNLGLAPFITLQNASGKVGSTAGILGQGFNSSSVVKFNGVAATTVKLTGTTYLTATVPAGATNGFVTVTTGSTTLKSTQKYTVHNSWASGATMPIATERSSAAVLSSNIYVIGGANASETVINNVQIYNPSTNTWSTGTPLPAPTQNSSAAVVNGVLYVFGGDDGVDAPTNAVWAYSATTKAWTSVAAMPTARNGTLAVVEKNIVYVIGGNLGNGANFVATVEAYNPATNSWTEETPMNGAKDYPGGGLIGTTVVVAGGASSGSQITGDTEGYNATSNAWSELTADPTPRTGPCSGVVGTALYDVGGYVNNNGAAATANESFSVSTNKWTTTLLAIPQGTFYPASAVASGQLYCFGGQAAMNSAAINNVQIYQP